VTFLVVDRNSLFIVQVQTQLFTHHLHHTIIYTSFTLQVLFLK